ncbi:MAG: septal ring lytic transglycosylase RlpA family protein [Gammaproteobacteria bacterium]
MDVAKSPPTSVGALTPRFGALFFHVWLVLAALSSGCTPDRSVFPPEDDGGPGIIPYDLDSIPDAVPRYEPRGRAGNPDNYVVLGKKYTVMKDSRNFVQRGIASWYGTKFHGKKTSNGEIYDMFAMTAAHKRLPIPCYARVTNLQNGRSIVVRINDRGPFRDNRVIDLSYTAAYKLGISKSGTGFVEIRTLEPAMPIEHTGASSAEDNAIFLQIGAFADQANALRLREKLNTHPAIPQPRVRIDSRRGNPVYKVQLGPIQTPDEVDLIAHDLTRLGITDFRVVVEKTGFGGHMLQ